MSPPEKMEHDALSQRAVAERQIDSVPLSGGDPAHPAAELLHELQVHQVEMEKQNKALRQKQIELEASRDRFREDTANKTWTLEDRHDCPFMARTRSLLQIESSPVSTGLYGQKEPCISYVLQVLSGGR
jgi:hypothetical protein